MILYPMLLVPTSPAVDSTLAQEVITAVLGTHPGVEHIRVRAVDDTLKLTAFLSAPDIVSALPLITGMRTTLSNQLTGWQLVPDTNFV